VIVTFAGSPVVAVTDLHRLLDARAIGSDVEVTVLREGATTTLRVRPDELRRVA
jgi:S1-C subfamily serine protease